MMPRPTGHSAFLEKLKQGTTTWADKEAKAELRRKGKQVAILAFGSMVAPVEVVGEKLNATVVNMRFVKPLDEVLVLELAETHDYLVTVEENVIAGGAGSAVNECLHQHQVLIPVLNLGLPDQYVEHASRDECLADCMLDSDGIEQNIRAYTKAGSTRKSA